jgi:hypothetical protein
MLCCDVLYRAVLCYLCCAMLSCLVFCFCSALRYRDMKVEEVMTLAKSVFMLSINEKLNYHVSELNSTASYPLYLNVLFQASHHSNAIFKYNTDVDMSSHHMTQHHIPSRHTCNIT